MPQLLVRYEVYGFPMPRLDLPQTAGLLLLSISSSTSRLCLLLFCICSLHPSVRQLGMISRTTAHSHSLCNYCKYVSQTGPQTHWNGDSIAASPRYLVSPNRQHRISLIGHTHPEAHSRHRQEELFGASPDPPQRHSQSLVCLNWTRLPHKHHIWYRGPGSSPRYQQLGHMVR